MKSLGIIGGLGPAASAYFVELITELTDAKTDQEHLEIILFSRPNVPDRTAYILDSSAPSPAVSMSKTAKQLESLGVSYIVAPCVTSHYVFDDIQAAVGVPMVHMVRETVAELTKRGKKKAGIMATTGTIASQLFQNELRANGIEHVEPQERVQEAVMRLIYDNLKAGKPVDVKSFDEISQHFFDANCDSIILGCTELSLVNKAEHLNERYVDTLEVLAKRCIELCGGKVKTI